MPLTVFIPENVGNTDRTVTLTVSLDGIDDPEAAATQTITQRPPLWAGNTGWEQIDDGSSGAFGFQYTEKKVYVYNNSGLHSTIERIVKQVDQLVTQYNAEDYVTCKIYSVGFLSYRCYVEIDYSKLNYLSGVAQSADNGLTNTRELFSYGGHAISRAFEEAVTNLKRIGHSSTPAFREWSATQEPSTVPKPVEGNTIDMGQALTAVLKKNRYFLNNVTGDELTTQAPYIREEDIKWYLPARGQFATAPQGGFSGALSGFWSSTAPASDLSVDAYTGASTLVPRTTVLSVRAARNN